MTGRPPKKTMQVMLHSGGLVETDIYKYNHLLRTETRYVVNRTDLEVAKNLGIEKCKFVATLGSRTSSKCREQYNKTVYIKDTVIGVNTLPLHPFFRSIMIDYIPVLSDDREWERNTEVEFDDADISKFRPYIETIIPGYLKNNVVLFKERLNHIMERHSNIDSPVTKVKEAIEASDKILEDSKQVNTLFFLKESGEHSINTVVKISVADNKENSIITAMIIRKNSAEKLQSKHKTLYIKKKKIV